MINYNCKICDKKFSHVQRRKGNGHKNLYCSQKCYGTTIKNNECGARITANQASQIHELLKQNIKTPTIARTLNISVYCVYNIKYGRTWKKLAKL